MEAYSSDDWYFLTKEIALRVLFTDIEYSRLFTMEIGGMPIGVSVISSKSCDTCRTAVQTSRYPALETHRRS